jgi:Gnt-I system high-affinity gluconate transporter
MAALSVTHGFLPPHPAPTALIGQFGANMGQTLMYGICIAIPAIIIGGPLFSKTLKNIPSKPLETFQPNPISEDKMPGRFASFFTALFPVGLLMLTTALQYAPIKNSLALQAIEFFKTPSIVMLLALVVATYLLGVRTGKSIKQVMKYYEESVKDVIMILLIVAAAGAMKQVLEDSGSANIIAGYLTVLSIHPLVLGWLIAAIIRVCLGSSTIAGLTAAGILSPIVMQTGINPNLMVLAVGSGSLAFSHVNDAGFWLFKEYFNLSIKDTLRSWSAMETIVAIVGLVGVLILDKVV